jgi:hypothetical protein
MKNLVMVVAVLAAPAVMAHELDVVKNQSAQKQLTQEQIASLPKTAVVRVSKSNPNQVEVIKVNEHLVAGKPVSFEQLAAKAEVSKLALNSANELDATSSTSSTSWGYIQGPRGNSVAWARGGYNRPYYPNYFRPHRPYYGNASYYYSSYQNYDTWAYPQYYVSGNNCGYYNDCRVQYQPYYGYQDNDYYYAYCDRVY